MLRIQWNPINECWDIFKDNWLIGSTTDDEFAEDIKIMGKLKEKGAWECLIV